MRIYSIDLLKFIFAMLVVFSHMDIHYPGASVAVDFFFVFSGFFLAKKFYGKSFADPESYNQFKYTADHVKKLYPQYIFSLLVLLCYMSGRDLVRIAQGSENAASLGSVIFRVFEIIPDSIMIQNMGGFVGGGLNAAAWYVSAMLIIGYFVYTMLCYNEKKTTEFILPLLFILTAAFMNGGKENFGIYGWFYIPLVRCTMYMAEGVVLYKLSLSKTYKSIKNSTLLFNLMGLFGLAAIFTFQRYKNIHIVLFAFIVLYTTNNASWINKVIKGKIFARIGDLSYAVYLNHSFVIMALEDAFAKGGIVMEHVQFAWIAAAASVVYSIFTMLLLDKLKPFCANSVLPALKAKKIV
ncbi:MAG: acyltransferase family protein [Oscillospiraceae bacterium]|nr:acyltransferase family protein [Oscillospiraceae bacterium]